MAKTICSQSYLGLGLLLSILLFALVGCAPDADPFAVGDRARTPTPVGTFNPNATPVPTTDRSGSASTIIGKGMIKFADDGTNNVQFGSTLVGYIMVWGYGYSAELVNVREAGYQKALEDGLVDVAVDVDKTADADWYNAQIAAGKIIDAGSLYGADSNKRIIVVSTFRDRAAELVDFLAKAVPGQEAVDKLTAQMTGGRTGIRANVAALIYLKDSASNWPSWVTPAVKEGVDAAVAAGKSSLLNRACIPDGGAGGGSPNCGT
ncbi:MAG: hypothetical protein FJ319_07880 [SAR202 cluster bacterium]|nr:hypothetical protein [SAR202 cluster bacterium]